MKQHPTHRHAAAWLLAAAALPIAPLAAQDVPVVNAPPPVTSAPAPAPAPALPPISVAPPPRPVTITPPAAPAPAPVATRAPAPAARTAAPARTRAVVRTPIRQVAPAPAPAPIAAAPEPVPVTTPTEVAPLAAPAPADVGTASAQTASGSSAAALWPWLAAAGLAVIAALAFLAFRRRRRAAEEEVYYEEAVYEAPVEAAPEPSFTPAAPVIAAAPLVAEREREPLVDEVALVDSDAADVEALAAGSEPVAGRPWLEFLMRPLRAGTSRDDAIVQFELTVGNTGSVEAKDVRISTWMVAGGQGTDMERSLIDPPADATINEVDIAAGDGARVEARIALPKSGMTEPVLPVVVADARYTLPDGSEGRTHATFAIGRPEGEELAPFPIDRSSGLSENVEARLHGEPERV